MPLIDWVALRCVFVIGRYAELIEHEIVPLLGPARICLALGHEERLAPSSWRALRC